MTYSTGRPHRSTVSADEILLAAGKTPNTARLGLDGIGIHVDDMQTIPVSPTLQTTLPHIYAAGDVTNLPKRVEMTAAARGCSPRP